MSAGPHDDLPADVRWFLRVHVDSVDTLEILLVLRNEPGEWSTGRLTERLRIPAVRVTASLQRLKITGLVSLSADVASWCPRSADAAAGADQLSDAYRGCSLAVMTEINAQHWQRRNVWHIRHGRAPVRRLRH